MSTAVFHSPSLQYYKRTQRIGFTNPRSTGSLIASLQVAHTPGQQQSAGHWQSSPSFYGSKTLCKASQTDATSVPATGSHSEQEIVEEHSTSNGARWSFQENGGHQQDPQHHNGLIWPARQDSSTSSRESSPASPNLVDTAERLPSIVRLLYATGWPVPIIHYSVQGASWQTALLEQVSSSRRQLCEVVIDLPRLAQQTPAPESAATLEFVITDGQGSWDKPAAGGNYSLSGVGTFVLRDGQIKAVSGGRYLVVSDLDDTLIGNDDGTRAFRLFWEQEAALRGSRLVFNTGRALDSFLALQAEKADCLPTPDMLIAAVGTKIYECRGTGWAEDAEFAARLDEGWDLNVVREACYQAVMAVGRDAMHFRPPEEQNDHKVTCGVLASSAAEVQKSIQLALDDHEVRAKLVFSGKGDWRYLDIVSENAGKAEALNFAMQKLGFSHESTIACGDSGNDKDMLAAANLAIVVGNAQPDLKQWLAGLDHNDLHSQGRLRLAQATAHHAFGILEGLQQLGFQGPLPN